MNSQSKEPAEWRSLAAERFAALDLSALGHADVQMSDLPGDVSRVLASSRFVADALATHPDLLPDLVNSGDLLSPFAPGALTARLSATLPTTAPDEDLFMAALRTVRRREMVRIAWRDIGGLSDIDATLTELSDLADALVEAAHTGLEGQFLERFGTPLDSEGNQQRLVIFALGKLGSHELNFSSDIDLILAYPRKGVTSKGVENETFFLRLARRLIRVLSEPTRDGIVYRVDMRLRPFGQHAPLVSSFESMAGYYEAHGRDWERFALLRARPIAGGIEQGNEFLQIIEPFIFRRYLDFGAVESLRQIKQTINQEMVGPDSPPAEEDIKRGPGGIRELEFVVQAEQLLRGGRISAIRHGSILSLLDNLSAESVITAQGQDDLRAAYGFLRQTENRLQQADDRQIHTLPTDPEGRAKLAVAMGLPDTAALEADLRTHRGVVQTHFEAVLGSLEPKPIANGAEHDPAQRGWEAGWGSPDTPILATKLETLGLADQPAILEQLQTLQRSRRIRELSPRAQRMLDQVVEATLNGAVASLAPAETVRRVFAILEQIVQRTAYLALLAERPQALSQLIKLCAASPWLAEHLGQHPQVFDELIDTATLYQPPGPEALEARLKARLATVSDGDIELEMDTLRYFQQASVLRIAAAEITDAIPLMIVSDRLTELAELSLRQVLQFAWRDLVLRHGRPTYRVPDRDEVETAPFAIVAYGKLGGIELSYGSDLDLVFLHGGEGENRVTDGERVIDNATFFARLGRKIIHWLSARTRAGRLYEVDSRLRPSGSAGLLVTSLPAFERYQREEAWTWEHQALVRARVVAGDALLGTRFAEVRAAILKQPRDIEALRGEVREMRARMIQEHGSKPGELFHLKQDPGGIADIEFLVQYGVLKSAGMLGSDLQYTDNIRLLDGLRAAEVAPSSDLELLGQAYRALRTRIHALDLLGLPPRVAHQEFEDITTAVRAIWGRWMT